MQKQFDVFAVEAPDVLAVHWGYVLVLGAILAALGVLAIWKAREATSLYVRFLGFLILLSAIAVFGFSFSFSGYWTEFFVHVIWAVFVAGLGLILLLRPMASAEAITLVIAFYFLIGGLMSIGFAITGRVENLGLYIGEGLISLFLGALLLIGWPITGLWAIGTFVGVDLLLRGFAIFSLGLGLRAISA
jgi:uncharacterized membrane protein HdeD (DUF308 family)